MLAIPGSVKCWMEQFAPGGGASGVWVPPEISGLNKEDHSRPSYTERHSVELGEDMAFFSSLGPTSDGRRKPDVVAPGYVRHHATTRPTHIPELVSFINCISD